jgi:hypothetical protein
MPTFKHLQEAPFKNNKHDGVDMEQPRPRRKQVSLWTHAALASELISPSHPGGYGASALATGHWQSPVSF